MFPLPVASDLKLRASCADSERQTEKQSRSNNKTKVERKRKWLGEVQRGPKSEEKVKIPPSSQSRICFGS